MLYVILMHISHFIFFCSWLITCYLFYIYFRLGKWCYTKSKFEQFSYWNSKWVVKQRRQLTTMHLAQELLTDVWCGSGSRSFAKETRALKMRSAGAGHQKLTTTNWEDHQSWSSCNYRRSCWRASALIILWSFGIWSKLERWKSSEWMPHVLCAKSLQLCPTLWNPKDTSPPDSSWDSCLGQKNRFEISSPLILHNSEPFLDRIVICDQK